MVDETIREQAIIEYETALQRALTEAEEKDKAPFEDRTEYLKELTKLPEFYPDQIKEIFWGYYGKDILLGNLDKQDMLSYKNRMAIITNIAFIGMPDYEYTMEKYLTIANFRHYGANILPRGKDGFERIMETQQTRLSIAEQKIPQQALTSPRRGILSRVLGGFGR